MHTELGCYTASVTATHFNWDFSSINWPSSSCMSSIYVSYFFSTIRIIILTARQISRYAMKSIHILNTSFSLSLCLCQQSNRNILLSYICLHRYMFIPILYRCPVQLLWWYYLCIWFLTFHNNEVFESSLARMQNWFHGLNCVYVYM